MTETPQQDRLDTEHLRDFSQFRRSVTDRKVAGVAGGLGRHLNIDPTVLRVAFVVLCFFGGAGFVLYGAAWLFVPEEGKTEAAIRTSPSTRNGLLIVAAVIATLLVVGDSWGGFGFPWPLAIVAVIVFVVLMSRDKPIKTQNSAAGETGTAPAVYEAGPNQPGAEAPTPPWMPPAQQPYEAPIPKPDRGPKLFWVTVALVAVALGLLGMYEVAGGPVVDAAYPALALTVVGTMLVVGAWVGRAGGLILLGIVAAVALAITATVTPRFEGERQINAHPVTAAQVRSSYYVPAGSIHLDLTDVEDIEQLDGRRIDVSANAGEIIVTIPDGVDVDVQADISVAGEAQVLGETSNGPSVAVERQIDGGPEAPHIELDMELLVGSIELRQS